MVIEDAAMPYELTDDAGTNHGSFGSLEKAQAAAPDATDWRAVEEGFRWNGWRGDAEAGDKPHYTVQLRA
jgi:hypothetical protein